MLGSIKTTLFILVFAVLLVWSVEADCLAGDMDEGSRRAGSQVSIPSVIINEIHYDPDVKTELVEFVELHNAGTIDVDLSGWYFCDGISYQFPAGSILPAAGYIIVAQEPAAIGAKWNQGRFKIPAHLVFGPFEGKLDNDGEKIKLCNADGEGIDEVDYKLGFPWPTVGDAVPENVPGTGHSIQLVNPFFDNDLAGSWRSAYPTPAAKNTAVYADNIPPHIRQVEHSPKQPVSGQVVTISAKVTDPDGVANVTLLYQLVDPGNYMNLNDAGYRSNWAEVSMHDDGLDGDKIAGDDIYTAQLSASLQTHRRLVRYRVAVVDNGGRRLVVPYPDDPQPNFAYFVYDGVPAWRGAIRPGATAVVEYSAEVMRSLPIYHLISKKSDVETCTWLEKYMGSEYKWYGTLVYDGQVYDHIRYRARGGVWRYAMGKNMWKFDFNRGNGFQARDDYGREYKTTWDKLNLSACIQQGDYWHRGEQGMFEAVTFKLFNIMGVPSPKTHWIQFRIIDERYEDGSLNAAHPPITTRGTQYDGDFWGLYLVIEQMDGRFLDEHDLPDGNLYKMEGHNGSLNNQGPAAVTDGSDLNAFKQGYYYDPDPTEQWWRQNVDLQCYYSYRCVVEGTHHGDVGYGKNYFFYLNPQTNIWSQLPWDVDLTWANNMYGDGEDPFRKQGGIHRRSALFLEFQNRLRECHDLLYNPEQMNQLLDEFASIIDDPSGALSIVDADRAMWDYHWVMGDAAYPTYLSHSANRKAGQGRFYQKAATKDFRGMVQIMKDYVVSNNRAFDTPTYDPDLPYKPTVTATCSPDFPINTLTFETTAFSDPQGSRTFAAMKWRIAEVRPGKYEIDAVWESEELTQFNSRIRIPASGLKVGSTYRVRCRMKDNTGRWSHWSEPIQFVTGEPLSANILNDLRITEVMYNPAAPSAGDPTDNDEFEFIELKNIGDEILDLTYVSFVEGISFDFGGSSIRSLAPGAFVLVVKNIAAFESRYGRNVSAKIAGQYSGKLANEGEKISLVDFWNGTIAQFEYGDGRGWPLSADGAGHSLVPLDSALLGQPEGSLNYGGNWRASTYIGGSPGRGDPESLTTVVLNEIMAHTDYSDPLHPQHTSNDWVELYNTTGTGINLADWYLSDDIADLKKWAIPAIELMGRSRVSFDEVTGFHNPLDRGFGLNKAGEQVILSCLPGTSQGRVVDFIEFKGQENGISLGRWPDGGEHWFRMTPSQDAANAEPILDMVIDELMYHPAGSNDEYVELYNSTAARILLENAEGTWRLDGAVSYTFEAGTAIPAGGRLIAVGFDPHVETTRLDNFIAAYNTGPLTAGVDIVGPWSGNLSNAGERLALEMPQPPDQPGQPVSWVVVDEVIYGDVSPWPKAADGGGETLQRIYADQYHCGNDPSNWSAARPSPGLGNLKLSPATGGQEIQNPELW